MLEARGIDIRLGARVRAASRDHVHLADGSSIATRTFVCTIGNAPNPIVRDLVDRQGFVEAAIEGRKIGALLADEMLRCPGKTNHWVVGDCAGIPNVAGKGFCPPTAQYAIREAKVCARNVLATIDGKPLARFVFKALGILASLGQRRAVAEVMGIRLTGFIAWFLWRTVYLLKLPGFLRKLRVALDWTIDLFFARDITQLRVATPPRFTVQHFESGEIIVKKGEIGRELFVVVSGEVRVEERDVRLGARDVFGELALLKDVPRTATVRASVPTDVLVVSRHDFRSMISVFPVLQDHFAKLLHDRHPTEAP
jgi:NADH dehydrogenase